MGKGGDIIFHRQNASLTVSNGLCLSLESRKVELRDHVVFSSVLQGVVQTKGSLCVCQMNVWTVTMSFSLQLPLSTEG